MYRHLYSEGITMPEFLVKDKLTLFNDQSTKIPDNDWLEYVAAVNCGKIDKYSGLIGLEHASKMEEYVKHK